jgi:hypothetical protein
MVKWIASDIPRGPESGLLDAGSIRLATGLAGEYK